MQTYQELRLEAAGGAVRTYKSLANVEKIFKTLKTRDLGIRSIRHYTENRARAHVFLCMLAVYLTWHLRTAWAPLTYTDENRPTPQEPVAKVTRSNAAARKASTRKLDDGSTTSSYQDLSAHMANRAGASRSTDGRSMAAATTTVLTNHQETPNATATSDAARPEVTTASLSVSFNRAVERANRGT